MPTVNESARSPNELEGRFLYIPVSASMGKSMKAFNKFKLQAFRIFETQLKALRANTGRFRITTRGTESADRQCLGRKGRAGGSVKTWLCSAGGLSRTRSLIT